MKEEITFYADNQGIRITSARIIIGNTTYSLANITSVRNTSARPSRRTPLKLLVIGIGVFLLGLGLESGMVALLGVLMGALGSFWLKVQKPTYHLDLASASGETRALRSQDGDRVEKITQAINEAMIQRS